MPASAFVHWGAAFPTVTFTDPNLVSRLGGGGQPEGTSDSLRAKGEMEGQGDEELVPTSGLTPPRSQDPKGTWSAAVRPAKAEITERADRGGRRSQAVPAWRLPDDLAAASRNPPEAAFTSAPALQERRHLTAATLLQARITWEPAVVPGLSRAAPLGGCSERGARGGGSREEYHRDCSRKAREPPAVTWPGLALPRHRPSRWPAGAGKPADVAPPTHGSDLKEKDAISVPASNLFSLLLLLRDVSRKG